MLAYETTCILQKLSKQFEDNILTLYFVIKTIACNHYSEAADIMLSSRPVMKERKLNPLQPVCMVFPHLNVIKSPVDMTVINSWCCYPHSEMHNLPVT